MTSPDYDIRLLAVAAAALPAILILLLHGRKRAATPTGSAIGWIVCALVGVGFIILASLAAFMKEQQIGGYRFGDQLIRGGSLGCGLILVISTLLALLPRVLTLLEAGPFSAFMSARLLHANRSGFLTVIGVLSVSGVALSSCTLCSVTSIMGGFGADLKHKILGNSAHIKIDVTQPTGFVEWTEALSAVRHAIAASGGKATPVVGGEAMASSATNTAGTLMRGIDPETIGDVISLKDNIEIGQFDYLLHPERLIDLPEGELIGRGIDGGPYYKGPGFRTQNSKMNISDYAFPKKKVFPGIIVGRELAKSLHVFVGDELTMLSPRGELGPMGVMPRARKFRVAGYFYSGMYEYDASHAYVLLDVAQDFLDLKGRISTIDVKLPVPEIVAEIRPLVNAAIARINHKRRSSKGSVLDSGMPAQQALRVRDWKEMNKNLFSALKLEKVATFIILSIASVVASFCIVCTLLLMVTEKTKEIAVLKALGATDPSIRTIFMLQGVLLGAFGTIFGVANALALCLGLSWSGVRLDPDVYYIERLPVNVDLGDYGLVALCGMLICTVATIYPARMAARVRPIDGLRYE